MKRLRGLFNIVVNKLIIKETTEQGEIKKRISYRKIALLVLSIVLIIGIGFYFSKEKVKNEIQYSNNKAEYLFYEGSFEESISEFKSIQSKDTWPIWIVRESEIYSVKGEFDKSNELLEEAIKKRDEIVKDKGDKVKDEDEQFLNHVVFTFLMNGEKERALELGQDYMQRYKDNKELIRTMVVVNMVNDKKENAMELIKEYPVDKTSAYDMSVYARMEMTIDEWDVGLSLLKDAWYLDKDEIKVFDVISQMFVYNDEFLEDKINKLVDENKDEPCYKLWQAKIYSMKKETAKKAETILGELNNNGDIGRINVEIIKSKTYQNIGEEEKAKTILDGLMELKDESYIGYHIAALYYFDNGDYDQAFDYCKKSIIKNKNYPDNYGFVIPNIMIKQGKGQEAEPYMRTALLKEPFNYNLMLSISDYYWYSAKDSNKALNYLNMASKIKPTDEKILYTMAMIKINDNKLEEAGNVLNDAIKINDSDPKIHRALGTIYFNTDKGEEGLKQLEKAYEVKKDDALTLNNLGCAYISIDGDVEKGMEKLEEAKEQIDFIKDEKIKEQFNKNYDSVKKLYDDYVKEDGSELQVPDLTLFY